MTTVVRLIICSSVFCAQALCTGVDIFPLKRGLTYEYEHFYVHTLYSYLFNSGRFVDSGLVQCIVIDSTSTSDTTISWTIEQRSRLLHTYTGPGWPDTSYWSEDTLTFILIEGTAGQHPLITPVFTNRTWYFSPEDSVRRFSDSSSLLITREWSGPLPVSERGIDSLWFSDTSGFYQRRQKIERVLDRVARLWTQDFLGITLIHNPTVDVRNREMMPASSVLKQNYPNPFNPATTFSFEIPYSSFVTLKIFDILGREVATLVNEEMEPGSYERVFDARLHSPNSGELASGVYFYQLKGGGVIETKKMLLAK